MSEPRSSRPANPTSHKASSQPNRRPAPRLGDVLASEPSARADLYEISVVPAPAHMVVQRYPDAIDRVRELAGELRVDGWYTVDQTHYVEVARHRTSHEG
jgi:hypothetical protein